MGRNTATPRYSENAIFAFTTDRFIKLTSNVFTMLELRAMYLLLAGMHGRFHLLSYGLALVLIGICRIPMAWSLAANGGDPRLCHAVVAADTAHGCRAARHLPVQGATGRAVGGI